MSVTRIAHRYAKPFLELAEEKKAVDAVYADMVNFRELCEASRDFVMMLRSPIIPHLKKATILDSIFSKKVNPITSTFLNIVARKNREKYLPEIASEFITLYNVHKGYQEATVTTSVKLDGEMKKAFEKLVKEITSKEPILKEKINPEIVGGYILQLGDQQIDESISGQLKDLKLKFQKETI